MTKIDRSMMPTGGGIRAPQVFHRLIILVLDGSDYMKEWQSPQKIPLAQAVSNTVRDTFSKFKANSWSRNFSFAVVYYSDTARIEVDITDARQIDDDRAYDPTAGMGGTASIAVGLKEAQKLADNFLAGQTERGVVRSVVITILSAGLDMTQSETISVANALRSNPKITVSSCFFETLGGDKKLIEESSNFLKGLCVNTVTEFISCPEKLIDYYFIS
jgi:hypothetical protein